MWFLYDNIVAIQVAVVACAFAWIFGGTVAWAILPVMPWLLVILLEVMVCYPQRHMGESTYMARDRVWRAMRKDPLVWVALAFILLLVVPFCNKGLCPVCGADLNEGDCGCDRFVPDPRLAALQQLMNKED